MKKEQKTQIQKSSPLRGAPLQKELINIEKLLRNLPKTPGVYQMKDKSGKVIYVGKSVNLKSRVSSYFQDRGTLTLAKRQMVDKIMDIETLLCQTEVEALVLETNLIKHLTPKYNILMKDDKNLAYIKITKSPIPEVIKTRQKIQDGATYFGPYTQGSNIYECVKELKRLFRIRNCRMKFENRESKIGIRKSLVEGMEVSQVPSIHDSRSTIHDIEITDKAGRTVPCMDYYIGLCPAPCLLESSKIIEHSENIEKLKRFLRGEQKEVLDEIRAKMLHHAKNLEFEEAQKMKELIDAVGVITERQLARDIIPGDHDIFVVLEKYEKLYVGILQIRNSQIIGIFRHTIEGLTDTREDMITQFLARQYIKVGPEDVVNLPSSLITTEIITDGALIEFLKNQNIEIISPTIGTRKELLDFTQNQLREYAYKSELATLENNTLTRAHMANVLERLGYEVPKKGEITFECYDISHTHGQFTYASRVLIANGKPDPKRYKKYKIKTLEAGEIDDFASHREVMMRRTIEGLELQNFPHLIIIDGGKGQLSSALSGIKEGKWKYENAGKIKSEKGEFHEKSSFASRSVIPDLIRDPEKELLIDTGFLHAQEGQTQELGYIRIPLCSIAKREEEIFIPGQKTPIMFEKGTGELMVLQKARDEAHRFSITANRSARMKSMKKNILEELPGFGPVTRKKLLKLSGGVDVIKSLSEDQILSVCTHAQLETLRDHGLWSGGMV